MPHNYQSKIAAGRSTAFSLSLRKAAILLFILAISAAVAWSQRFRGGFGGGFFGNLSSGDAVGYTERVPPAEFRMARIKYPTRGGAGSHGIIQPWWAVD